jgi:predicted nucleic acid-binding Zn ribbon protein
MWGVNGGITVPLYAYKCQQCGTALDGFRAYEERDRPEDCCSPGSATRIFAASRIVVDYPGYVSPATGKWVEGRKAHREDLARSGCRVLEPGESEAYMKNVEKRRDESFEKTAGEAIEAAARDIGLI